MLVARAHGPEDWMEIVLPKLSLTSIMLYIIIVAAHSRRGYWVHELSPERRALVMDKCDLVLSATTHNYSRQIIEGYEDAGALCLNTGSVCYARDANQGYIQVHVFANGQMLVQYISATSDERLPSAAGNQAYLKEIGGQVWQVRMAGTAAEDVGSPGG